MDGHYLGYPLQGSYSGGFNQNQNRNFVQNIGGPYQNNFYSCQVNNSNSMLPSGEIGAAPAAPPVDNDKHRLIDPDASINTFAPLEVQDPMQDQRSYYDDEFYDLHSLFADKLTTTEDSNWKNVKPKNWEPKHTMSWILHKMEEFKIDILDINMKSFREIDGLTLMSMSEEEFVKCDNTYGSTWYKAFRKMLNQEKDIELSSVWNMDNKCYMNDSTPEVVQVANYNLTSLYPTPINCDTISSHELSSELLPQNWCSQTVDDYAKYCGNTYGQECVTHPEPQSQPQQQQIRRFNGPEQFFYAQNVKPMEHMESDSSDVENKPVKSTRRPGRPPGRPPSLHKKPKVNKVRGGGRLWEFVRDLLHNRKYNPSMIRWENEDDGVFKIVQSRELAQLWGVVKNNKKMTYEKMSRALRYNYKPKTLLPVRDKRLVYKFGPNAVGWKSKDAYGTP